MAVNKAFLEDLSPEFSSVDSGRIDRLVAIVEPLVPAERWGSKVDLAVALYVAHMITVGDTAAKGAVASERLGPMERTFAKSSGSGKTGDNFESTAWGRQYKALARTVYSGPLIT